MLLLITCLSLGINNTLMGHPSAVFSTSKCHFLLSRPLFSHCQAAKVGLPSPQLCHFGIWFKVFPCDHLHCKPISSSAAFISLPSTFSSSSLILSLMIWFPAGLAMQGRPHTSSSVIWAFPSSYIFLGLCSGEN